MDLSLTEQQELLQRAARDFLTTECPEAAMRALDATETQFSREVWDKMAELGWMGLLVPEQYGGFGGSYTDMGVLAEQLGRAVQPTTLHSTAVIGALLLTQAGSDSQKSALLPTIANGKAILALAATEADYGWAATDIRSTTAAQAAGGWAINGAKHFVHDAHVADTLIVAARTGSGATDITLFLVPANAAGLTRRRIAGNYSDHQSELAFSNVQVGAEAVLGGVNQGWAALSAMLQPAAAIMCAYMAGAMETLFELTVEYAKTRRQFGTAIGTFQRVQDHIIDVVNAYDGARWTAFEALWKLDTGKKDAGLSVSTTKIISSDGFDRATFHSHEVHAGVGISREYPLFLYTKKARTLYNYLGDPRHHRELLAQGLDL